MGWVEPGHSGLSWGGEIIMIASIRVAFVVGFAFAITASLSGAVSRQEGKTISLFNGKDLSGWSTFVDSRTKGYSPESRPENVFKVEDGLIHVSGERFGCLTTVEEFENYKLSLEFKWGEKRWAPREKAVRDSGVLVHCVGPDKIWTKSIECQIQEHDCGDFWLVSGTTLEIDGTVEKNMRKKKKDAEKPTGQWNTIEVVCDGDKITNIVNGVVVNEGIKASVTKGRILLQSEGAEVYFRNVELTPLKSK
jgi:hypothetical protein